jgi:hypothetical protein
LFLRSIDFLQYSSAPVTEQVEYLRILSYQRVVIDVHQIERQVYQPLSHDMMKDDATKQPEFTFTLKNPILRGKTNDF